MHFPKCHTRLQKKKRSSNSSIEGIQGNLEGDLSLAACDIYPLNFGGGQIPIQLLFFSKKKKCLEYG